MTAGLLFLGLDQADYENRERDDDDSCCGVSLPVHGFRSREFYRFEIRRVMPCKRIQS